MFFFIVLPSKKEISSANESFVTNIRQRRLIRRRRRFHWFFSTDLMTSAIARVGWGGGGVRNQYLHHSCWRLSLQSDWWTERLTGSGKKIVKERTSDERTAEGFCSLSKPKEMKSMQRRRRVRLRRREVGSDSQTQRTSASLRCFASGVTSKRITCHDRKTRGIRNDIGAYSALNCSLWKFFSR